MEGSLEGVLNAIQTVVDKNLHHAPRVVVNLQLDVYPGQESRLAKKHAVIQQVQNEIKKLH